MAKPLFYDMGKRQWSKRVSSISNVFQNGKLGKAHHVRFLSDGVA